MKESLRKVLIATVALVAILMSSPASAQTDIDAIMMEKNAFCVGPMYGYSSWKNYWEGRFKRENLNLGRVSTQQFAFMGAYGLTRKINLLFSVPYVKTKASAGTLHGMKGVQDLSLFVKWKAYQIKTGDSKITLFGIGGASLPLTNYVADFLPLSIGLHSKTLSARILADYERGNLFATASYTYVLRDNVEIDRPSYYTTELHLTNEVEMPNATNFNFRAGFRNHRLIAEAVFNAWTTLGGFDITRNNMPFPSNRMNASTVGINVKYTVPSIPQLSIVAGGNTTVGMSDFVLFNKHMIHPSRNVGQATSVYGSFFYVFDLSKKKKSTDKSSNTN